MAIPLNILMWCTAALPILFLLFTMVKLNWSAAKAAPCAMVIAMTVAMTLYKTDIASVVTESLKGGWNALVILLVVWPAVFIYELSVEANAFNALKDGLGKITEHELLQIMILGWIFPSFLQGITGFGVAVAVGAPLLVGLGVAPLWSIVIVLLCHSWGATFGTLSLAWQALLTQTQISAGEAASTAFIAALLIGAYNFISAFCLCWFYGKKTALKEGLPALLILSGFQGGGQLILTQYNHTIACFLPACLSLLAAVALGRVKWYSKQWRLENSPIMARPEGTAVDRKDNLSFKQALFPYYILAIITVGCLLIPPVNQLLSKWKIGFSFPGSITGYGYETMAEPFFSPLAPLTYAGTFLIVTSAIGFLYYRRNNKVQNGSFLRIYNRMLKKTIPSSLAIVGLIVTSKVMSGSGQIYILSQGVAQVLGKWYALGAPLIGMLGSFVTSSNMSSNILFGQFQLTTAKLLNIPPAFLLAAQTAGGVIGTSFAPGSVILGTSTTGISGNEGKIMKTVLPIAASIAALFGVVVWIAIWLRT